MKKALKQLSVCLLTFALLVTSCMFPSCSFAGSRIEPDTTQEEYRYVIDTTYITSSTTTTSTARLSSYTNSFANSKTITRNFSDGYSSWSTSLGAHAAVGDLYSKPADYNSRAANRASFSVTLRRKQHVDFFGYKKKTTWTWKHTIQHQRRSANSTEWKTIDTSSSYSYITKHFTTFGYRIQ